MTMTLTRSGTSPYKVAHMEIKVLGPGCDECAYTVALVEKIARGAGVAFTITKVTNPGEIERLGVTATPTVVIDGAIVHGGGIPSEEQVAGWMNARQPSFLTHPTRHLFFTGKGGGRQRCLAHAAFAGKKKMARRVGQEAWLPGVHPSSDLFF